ncbi:MAG: DUF2726 domain-containing protein [Pseudomonadales bacterium]|nr:DUF2726 domain-containing protein [Candidatus Woesebacteria bacterium]MCB9801611.1 DUF2726 domain-containing protein [Pseudomonadales bacterium]
MYRPTFTFTKDIEQELEGYDPQRFCMTEMEQVFFEQLIDWYGEYCYIFPQMHFSSLFHVSSSIRRTHTLQNRIDRKSVDFVFVGKKKFKVVLLIELDDHSHRSPSRIERDKFVNMLCAKHNVPLLHFSPSDVESEEVVKKGIDDILTVLTTHHG